MPNRQQLHDAVERLPDSEISAALRYVEFLSALAEDEEPISPELERRLLEADAAIERGEGIPHDEILREFGLR